MKVYYHDLFTFPLPDNHRFPIEKYRLLRERIVAEGLVKESDLHLPAPATDEQLLLAHSQEYIDKIIKGNLSDQETRRMGFPWSEQLAERSRRSVGSTIEACRAALEDGMAVNLAGGTHHAGRDHGEGFCVFNDAAVASRVIQQEEKASLLAIFDTDVHQGNGTASILQGDPSIFTFSIHGENNFPFRKDTSDLDIGLPDNTGDEDFLNALEEGLREVLSSTQPDLIIYIAGADPFKGDRLGRLAISKQGLAQRDRMVLENCLEKRIPVAIVMGGGYAPQIKDIVDIHTQTIRIAFDLEQD